MLEDKFSPPALPPSATAWFRAVTIGTTTGCPLVWEEEIDKIFKKLFIQWSFRVRVWMDVAFQTFAEESLFLLVLPRGDGFQRAANTRWGASILYCVLTSCISSVFRRARLLPCHSLHKLCDSRLIWMIDVSRHHYATWTGFTNTQEQSTLQRKTRPDQTILILLHKARYAQEQFLVSFLILCSHSSDVVVLHGAHGAGWRGTYAKLSLHKFCFFVFFPNQ